MSPLPPDSSGMVAELDAAVAGLGALGDHLVPTGAILKLDAWLSRPAWLLDGVALSADTTDLPELLPLRDDVRITGNLLINVGFGGLVTLFARALQWPTGKLSALLTGFAPCLGAGVDAIIELSEFSTPHLTIDSRVEDDSRTLELHSTADLGPAGVVVALTFALQMHHYLQSLGATSPGQVELGFRWRGPDDPAQIPPVSGATFHFGRAANSVSYPKAWDSHRNPMHDPHLWETALRRIRAREQTLREAAVIVRVRRLVAEAIESDQRPPQLRNVAAALGKSVRSLERNLTEAGATFRTVVEEERKRLAMTMLSDRTRSIQEISDLLGFSDRTSFTRSFRTWFNVPPAAFRLQLKDAGHPVA